MNTKGDKISMRVQRTKRKRNTKKDTGFGCLTIIACLFWLFLCGIGSKKSNENNLNVQNTEFTLETTYETELIEETNNITTSSNESPSEIIETSPAETTEEKNNVQMVWISATGSKYHRVNNCSKMNPNTATQLPLDDAIRQGYESCSKCY